MLRQASMAQSEDAMFDRLVSVNLGGYFRGMRESARRMREGGRIINISTSVVGFYHPNFGVYAATKAGVDAMTHVLAKELGPRQITVNAVAPGQVETVLFLEGKTVFVSGLGAIGTEVAKRAHGLGMKVVATRVGGTGKPDFVDYVGQPDELLKLAKTADVVISAVPLTAETTHMYNKDFFAVLKPTAFFINIARGGSVDTDALMAALNEGRLGGAGLDVTEPEPLPTGHPLWKSPRVLITPHIAGRSDFPDDVRWSIAADNLRRYVAGEKIFNMVDLARGF
jgi:phosphoglycerate dehydrogenase-like enzyme